MNTNFFYLIPTFDHFVDKKIKILKFSNFFNLSDTKIFIYINEKATKFENNIKNVKYTSFRYYLMWQTLS